VAGNSLQKFPQGSLDDLVNLNMVCPACEDILCNNQILNIAPESPEARASQQVFEHHKTSEDLESSADGGCHSCSILLDALEPYKVILKMLEEALLPQKLSAFESRDSSYKIQLRTPESSRGLAFSPVPYLIAILFRETQHSDGNPPLFVQQANHPLTLAEDLKIRCTNPELIIWRLTGMERKDLPHFLLTSLHRHGKTTNNRIGT